MRGINVGGKNILPMAALSKLFAGAGCDNVQTYVQSGNVVFTAARPVAVRIQDVITEKIKRKFGLSVPIVLRNADEIDQVVGRNPFLKPGVDIKTLFVGFLADEPGRQQIAALDPKRSPGDSFKLTGREIFMHITNGAADTRLTNAYFDSTLKMVSTFRNWRTTLKLQEMLQAVTSSAQSE